MQILGLARSTPRSESRWRSLFWPTIRNSTDFDYIPRQGFWICFVVASLTLIIGALSGSVVGGVLEGVFFLLAGIGVRECSRVAAIVAFAAYLLSGIVLQRYTANGFNVIRVIFLSLLFANIRGSLLSARWADDPGNDLPPERLNKRLTDKLVNRMPALVWPKARFVFYGLASIEIALLLIALFAPRG